MHCLRALCACAPLLAASAAAGGQSPSLAVVELGAPQELSGIAARLTAEIAAAARGRYELVEPSAAAARLGPDLLQKLRDCKGEGACIATFGASLKTTRAVVGSLERTETSYLVKLWLVELKTGTVVSSVDRSVLIASRRLNSDIAAAVPAFLMGKAEAQGKLSIQSNARGASVVFDGEPVGQVPVTLEVKPGKHVLKVWADRYLPVERFVAVEAGRTQEMLVTLLLMPGALPPEAPAATAAARPRPAGAGSAARTFAWIAGGAAVASAGAGAFFGLSSKKLEDRAGAASPYAISRVDAQRGKLDAQLATGFFIGAGAAAGASALLFILGGRSSAAAPSAAVVPVSGGAVLAVEGAF